MAAIVLPFTFNAGARVNKFYSRKYHSDRTKSELEKNVIFLLCVTELKGPVETGPFILKLN
jgi:hypothetical protein